MEDAGGSQPDPFGGHEHANFIDGDPYFKEQCRTQRIMGGHSTHAGILPSSFVDIACYTSSQVYTVKKGLSKSDTPFGLLQRTQHNPQGVEPCYKSNMNEAYPASLQHSNNSPLQTNSTTGITFGGTTNIVDLGNFGGKKVCSGFTSKVQIRQPFERTPYIPVSNPVTNAAACPLKPTPPTFTMPYAPTGGHISPMTIGSSFRGATSLNPPAPVLPVREMQHCSQRCDERWNHAARHKPRNVSEGKQH